MIYRDLIAKSFNEAKNKIQKNIFLSKYNWDSMTKINLITNIDKKFDKITKKIVNEFSKKNK